MIPVQDSGNNLQKLTNKSEIVYIDEGVSVYSINSLDNTIIIKPAKKSKQNLKDNLKTEKSKNDKGGIVEYKNILFKYYENNTIYQNSFKEDDKSILNFKTKKYYKSSIKENQFVTNKFYSQTFINNPEKINSEITKKNNHKDSNIQKQINILNNYLNISNLNKNTKTFSNFKYDKTNNFSDKIIEENLYSSYNYNKKNNDNFNDIKNSPFIDKNIDNDNKNIFNFNKHPGLIKRANISYKNNVIEKYEKENKNLSNNSKNLPEIKNHKRCFSLDNEKLKSIENYYDLSIGKNHTIQNNKILLFNSTYKNEKNFKRNELTKSNYEKNLKFIDIISKKSDLNILNKKFKKNAQDKIKVTSSLTNLYNKIPKNKSSQEKYKKYELIELRKMKNLNIFDEVNIKNIRNIPVKLPNTIRFNYTNKSSQKKLNKNLSNYDIKNFATNTSSFSIFKIGKLTIED